MSYQQCTRFRTTLANISGTDQAIDKRKTALSATIFPMFDKSNLVNFGSLTKNDLDLCPMILKFNRVLEVVEEHVHANSHQVECSGSRVIVYTNFFPYLAMIKIRKSGPVTLTFDL